MGRPDTTARRAAIVSGYELNFSSGRWPSVVLLNTIAGRTARVLCWANTTDQLFSELLERLK